MDHWRQLAGLYEWGSYQLVYWTMVQKPEKHLVCHGGGWFVQVPRQHFRKKVNLSSWMRWQAWTRMCFECMELGLVMLCHHFYPMHRELLSFSTKTATLQQNPNICYLHLYHRSSLTFLVQYTKYTIDMLFSSNHIYNFMITYLGIKLYCDIFISFSHIYEIISTLYATIMIIVLQHKFITCSFRSTIIQW